MKLTLTPSEEHMSINGTECRIWTGHDEYGTEVKAWIATVSPQTHDPARLETFDRELKALPPLRPTGIDYRFFVD